MGSRKYQRHKLNRVWSAEQAKRPGLCPWPLHELPFGAGQLTPVLAAASGPPDRRNRHEEPSVGHEETGDGRRVATPPFGITVKGSERIGLPAGLPDRGDRAGEIPTGKPLGGTIDRGGRGWHRE